MARPTRPKAIPDLTEKTSMLTGDILLLTRLTDPPADYENFRISWDNLLSQLQTLISPEATPAELGASDRFAIEYFEDYDVGAITVADGGVGWSGNGVISTGSIVSRTMRGNTTVTQKRLALGSTGQYVRRFGWGDNWQRIIIAALIRLDRASTFGPARPFFGICSGTTNPVGGTCDNYIGIVGPNSGATDATFTAGSVANYFDINPSLRFCTKRGTTVTDRTSGSGSNGRHVSSTEGTLGIWLLEISRPLFATDATSVTYSLGLQQTDATRVQQAHTKDILRYLLETEPSSTMASNTAIAQIISSGLAGVTTSFAFDQSTGKLDALNFYWDQSFNCELAALGAIKVH